MKRMTPDYEKQLEARVRRELDALGEIPAPPTVAVRVMRRIAKTPAPPWYRRAWQTWPLGLRLASLTLLLGAFGALSFGAWELARTLTSLETSSSSFATAQALWRTAVVLGDIPVSFFNQLQTGVVVAGLAILFAAAATCLALGSACVRLAMRPAPNSIST